MIHGPRASAGPPDPTANPAEDAATVEQQAPRVTRAIIAGVSAATAAAGAPGGDVNALIAEAARDFTDYQQLTAAGKLAEAGQKLEALKRTLEELQTRRH